ncbi:MAG: hypothetical protein ACK5EA_05455 [Planctomycetaceae bacterium]
MLRSLFLMLCGVLAAIPLQGAERVLNQLTPEEIADGWIRLFDGTTTFGWKPNNDVNWQIVDGVIQADRGEPGLLNTKS